MSPDPKNDDRAYLQMAYNSLCSTLWNLDRVSDRPPAEMVGIGSIFQRVEELRAELAPIAFPPQNDGDENPCPTCGHPAPGHYAWSTECAHNDGGEDLRCGFCGGAPEEHADSDSGPMSVCPPARFDGSGGSDQ